MTLLEYLRRCRRLLSRALDQPLALTPACAALGVLAIEYVLYNTTIKCDWSWLPGDCIVPAVDLSGSEAATLADARGEVFWWHGASVLLAASALAALLTAVTAMKRVSAASCAYFWITLLATPIAIQTFRDGREFEPLLSLLAALDRVQEGPVASFSTLYMYVTSGLRSLTAFASVFVVAAFSGTLIMQRAKGVGGLESLPIRVAIQDALLYSAALMLVAALMEFSMLWGIPSSVFKANGEHLKSVGNAMMFADGITYTTLLAGTFVPARIILRVAAVALLRSEHADWTHGQVSAWLSEHGLELSLPKRVISVVAVLSPALAGSPIVDALMKLGE